MTDENQQGQTSDQLRAHDPNLGKANTPAATPGHPTTDPHITQAPSTPAVPFEELQQRVRSDRSVHSGVRTLVQGVRQRLEQIAGDTTKDANTLREEVRQVAGTLDADGVARSVIENTPAKNDPDPQANRPVAPVINR